MTDLEFRLRVYCLNGIGNACAVILPDQTVAVVDWGTTRAEDLDDLFELVRGNRFAFLAATHAHADHTVGLPGLIERALEEQVHIEHLAYPADTLHRPDSALTQARELARRHRIRSHKMFVYSLPGTEPPPLVCGEVDGTKFEVRVLAPEDDQTEREGLASMLQERVPGNETSLVLLFRFLGDEGSKGQGRIVLPGDATPGTLDFARRVGRRFPELTLDNQAFVVPHHGSSGNFRSWMLKYLHGQVAVSAPTDQVHHPSDMVLESLAAHLRAQDRREIYCTNYSGVCRTHCGQTRRVDPRLMKPGPCFGTITLRVPAAGSAELVSSSHDGEPRRAAGYCGPRPF